MSWRLLDLPYVALKSWYPDRMAENIIRGNVYWATDQHVKFAPSDENRSQHNRRPFLVISGADMNDDPGRPIVFGCPISTAKSFTIPGEDVCIPADSINLAKKCWVRISQAQPVGKSELSDFQGRLAPPLIAEVEASLIRMLGII